MTPLERLLAIEEIKTLRARYWIGVDTGRRDLLLSVFAPDAVIPKFGDIQETRTASDFVDNLIATLSQARTIHLGGTPDIRIVSDDRATGVWPMEDRIWAAEGASLRFSTLHGWGHYHDEYRRTEEGWKVQSFTLHRIRVDLT
jgi:hypothetical protein